MDDGLKSDTSLSVVLTASDLEIFRGAHRVCAGVNVAVATGERLEITGANGTGKTSLLRVFAGLSDDYTGGLLWYGQPWASCREPRFAQTSYIAHRTGFKDALSVKENLGFYALMKSGVTGREVAAAGADEIDGRIDSALARLGAAGFADRLFGALSEGQRRRVILARLLVEPTVLWLLDEPTAALDQEGIGVFERLLGEHIDRGGAAIVATHRPLRQTGRVQRLELSAAGASCAQEAGWRA